MAADDTAKRMYGMFSPSPLSPEQKDLYVDLEEVRGDSHVVNKLSKFIYFSPEKATCQVLAGHKGCGKSTELMCLKDCLESKYNYHVILCDIYPNLDLNDVDFPDLLLELVRQIADDLRDKAKIELKPTYFNELLQRIWKGLTTPISITSAELGGGDIGKLVATIKDSPDARHEIRKALEPHTNSLLEAANDLIRTAVLKLVDDKKRAGLVLLVDNLDKIIVRPMEGSNCDTAEYLFVNRAAQMTALACDVVYTMPISLAYSHQAQNIMSQYGGELAFVPATKVTGPPPKVEPYEEGICKFREIVERRLKKVNVPFEDAFESDVVLRELILLSGGQPTELMTLVREAITSGDLPIKSGAVERTKREGRREYARMLLAEHMRIAREIARKGKFDRTAEKEEVFRQLLNSRAVLQYVNDEEWYNVNPMVRDLIAEGKTRKK